MVWQGEKNHIGKLAYMYWPVMGTLIEGFRHAGDRVELMIGVGFSLAYHEAVARLRHGDTLIWLGTNGKLSQPWLAQGHKGTPPSQAWAHRARERRQ